MQTHGRILIATEMLYSISLSFKMRVHYNKTQIFHGAEKIPRMQKRMTIEKQREEKCLVRFVFKTK